MGDTERWDVDAGAYVRSPRADRFLADILAVCRKHGLALGHEDIHGAFEVLPYSTEAVQWLDSAHLQGLSRTTEG